MLVKSEPESETFTSDEQRQKFSEALQLIIAENECQLGATTYVYEHHYLNSPLLTLDIDLPNFHSLRFIVSLPVLYEAT